ncbi:MAG: flagellar motor switch protein FliN [Nakamurella sp.]
MTTASATIPLTSQLPAAATAIAQAWGLADALTAGDPTTALPDLVFAAQSVLVQFSGSVSGELVLAVDAEIAQQLMDSPAAPADLIAALAPATTAALMTLGEVTPTNSQVLDPTTAGQRIMALGEAAAVSLIDDGEVRAVVLIGASAGGTGDGLAASIPAQQRIGHVPGISARTADRLDLLRGVQMQATVELGRASMTINDLLALRSGTIVELDRAAGAPADLYVNGRLIAHGEVVVVDENYGLRILKVVADDIAAAR